MPKRITNSEDKLVPRLSFKIPLDLVFTLSIDYKTAEAFKLKMGNNDDTVSRGLRNMLFKKMVLKDKKEYYDFIIEQLEEIRRKTDTKLGVTRDKSFSEILVAEIKKNEK